MVGVDAGDGELATGLAKRTSVRHAADIKYVAALRHKTSCDPYAAMPRPLSAGPKTMPRLVVPWRSALAAVNCVLGTNAGMAAVRAGPNTAVAIACRRTNA